MPHEKTVCEDFGLPHRPPPPTKYSPCLTTKMTMPNSFDPFPFGTKFFGTRWGSLSSRIEVRGSGVCWPWMGKINSHGYGVLNGRENGRRVTFSGHRVAFEAATGERLGRLHVLHSCSGRNCCNPAHLRPGTNADNVRDRERFGRSSVGQGNGRAILTEAKVYDLISASRSPDGVDQAYMARELGVSRRTVWGIINKQRWPEVWQAWETFDELIGPPWQFSNPLL